MSAETKTVVTLGADVGGEDAYLATNDQVLNLRALLLDACQRPYSDAIKEFALVLRIDGSVQSWGKSGVANVVLRAKNGYATVDIFVPEHVWRQGTDTLRSFLAAEVSVAIAEIAKRAQKRKIPIRSEEINRDVQAALQKFLSS